MGDIQHHHALIFLSYQFLLQYSYPLYKYQCRKFHDWKGHEGYDFPDRKVNILRLHAQGSASGTSRSHLRCLAWNGRWITCKFVVNNVKWGETLCEKTMIIRPALSIYIYYLSTYQFYLSTFLALNLALTRLHNTSAKYMKKVSVLHCPQSTWCPRVVPVALVQSSWDNSRIPDPQTSTNHKPINSSEFLPECVDVLTQEQRFQNNAASDSSLEEDLLANKMHDGYQLKMFKGLPTFRPGHKVSNAFSCSVAGRHTLNWLQAKSLETSGGIRRLPYTLGTCASAQWIALHCGLLQPDDLFFFRGVCFQRSLPIQEISQSIFGQLNLFHQPWSTFKPHPTTNNSIES